MISMTCNIKGISKVYQGDIKGISKNQLSRGGGGLAHAHMRGMLTKVNPVTTKNEGRAMKAADRYLPWEAIYAMQEQPRPVLKVKQDTAPIVTWEPLKGGCILFQIRRANACRVDRL